MAGQRRGGRSRGSGGSKGVRGGGRGSIIFHCDVDIIDFQFDTEVQCLVV